MKIIAHTPRGVFESLEESVPPLDRAAIRAHLEKKIASATSLTMNSKDGFIILPGDIVGRSAFVVDNFNNPEDTE